MKLTPIAIELTDQLEPRLKLALLFRVTERRVMQLLKANRPFGPLVSPAALQVIREVTGLKDSQILEKVSVAA